MLLDLLKSVCDELNKLAPAGWEIDQENTKSVYLVRIKNAEGAIIEAFDGGKKITVSSTISHILTDNKSINVSATKTPAQIARDVKRRLLDGYTEACIAAKKKEEEQRERAKRKSGLYTRHCGGYLRTVRARVLRGWLHQSRDQG